MKVFATGLFAVCILLVASTASAHQSFTCTPSNIASFSNRVHVECNPGLNPTLKYFAVPTTDAAAAQRFLDIALAAILNNKTLTIRYELLDGGVGAAFGCAIADCRAASGITISK
jgi:hypothetical protein